MPCLCALQAGLGVRERHARREDALARAGAGHGGHRVSGLQAIDKDQDGDASKNSSQGCYIVLLTALHSDVLPSMHDFIDAIHEVEMY